MTELLPCPNPECGGGCFVRRHWLFSDLWCVQCLLATCSMTSPLARSEDDAIRLHNALPREERWVPVENDTYPSGVLDIWTSEGRCFEGCVFCDQHGDRGLVFDGLLDNDQGDWLHEQLDDDEVPTHYRRHVTPKGPGG